MLTFEDCVGLSELTQDEIDAIAEHEHIPELAALEMGNYLVGTEGGEKRIKTMIADDIKHAQAMGNVRHVATLKMVLKHYLEQHAGASGHGRSARAGTSARGHETARDRRDVGR